LNFSPEATIGSNRETATKASILGAFATQFLLQFFGRSSSPTILLTKRSE
jgi:hypothetical protein